LTLETFWSHSLLLKSCKKKEDYDLNIHSKVFLEIVELLFEWFGFENPSSLCFSLLVWAVDQRFH